MEYVCFCLHHESNLKYNIKCCFSVNVNDQLYLKNNFGGGKHEKAKLKAQTLNGM